MSPRRPGQPFRMKRRDGSTYMVTPKPKRRLTHWLHDPKAGVRRGDLPQVVGEDYEDDDE